MSLKEEIEDKLLQYSIGFKGTHNHNRLITMEQKRDFIDAIEKLINDWVIIGKRDFTENYDSLEVYGSNIFRGTIIKNPGVYEIGIRKIEVEK